MASWWEQSWGPCVVTSGWKEVGEPGKGIMRCGEGTVMMMMMMMVRAARERAA